MGYETVELTPTRGAHSSESLAPGRPGLRLSAMLVGRLGRLRLLTTVNAHAKAPRAGVLGTGGFEELEKLPPWHDVVRGIGFTHEWFQYPRKGHASDA